MAAKNIRPLGSMMSMKRMKPAKAARKGKHTPGKMNKTEARYEREIMIPALESGEILDYSFERVTLVLAHKHEDAGKSKGVRFTPDFMYVDADRIIWLIDVKAKRGEWTSMKDDAKDKIKLASSKFWMFRFATATWDSKTRQWVHENY